MSSHTKQGPKWDVPAGKIQKHIPQWDSLPTKWDAIITLHEYLSTQAFLRRVLWHQFSISPDGAIHVGPKAGPKIIKTGGLIARTIYNHCCRTAKISIKSYWPAYTLLYYLWTRIDLDEG